MTNRQYLLSPVERQNLLILVGNDSRIDSLADHYSKSKTHYDDWAKQLQNETFKLGKEEFNRNLEQVLKSLSSQISEFDAVLYKIVTLPAVQESLGLSHMNICRLLAKNSLASNAVYPGERK